MSVVKIKELILGKEIDVQTELIRKIMPNIPNGESSATSYRVYMTPEVQPLNIDLDSKDDLVEAMGDFACFVTDKDSGIGFYVNPTFVRKVIPQMPNGMGSVVSYKAFANGDEPYNLTVESALALVEAMEATSGGGGGGVPSPEIGDVGKFLSAIGEGTVGWKGIPPVVTLASTSGTLTDEQYALVQLKDCVILLDSQQYRMESNGSASISYKAAPRIASGKVIVDKVTITKATKEYLYEAEEISGSSVKYLRISTEVGELTGEDYGDIYTIRPDILDILGSEQYEDEESHYIRFYLAEKTPEEPFVTYTGIIDEITSHTVMKPETLTIEQLVDGEGQVTGYDGTYEPRADIQFSSGTKLYKHKISLRINNRSNSVHATPQNGDISSMTTMSWTNGVDSSFIVTLISTKSNAYATNTTGLSQLLTSNLRAYDFPNSFVFAFNGNPSYAPFEGSSQIIDVYFKNSCMYIVPKFIKLTYDNVSYVMLLIEISLNNMSINSDTVTEL